MNVLAHFTNVQTLLGELEAARVISEMPEPLSQREKDAITKFIREEYVAGNYQKFDYFVCFALASEANALKDFKQGIVAVNQGAVKTASGYQFGSNQSIDSSFNPVSDGENYQTDDCMFGAFVVTNDNTTVNKSLFSTTNDIQIEQQPSVPRIRYRINSNSALLVSSQSFFKDDTLYTASRTGSNATEAFEDGVSVLTGGQGSNVVDNQTIKIGLFQATYYEGVLATFIAGGGSSFSHPAHNTNVRNLLTSLGVTL